MTIKDKRNKLLSTLPPASDLIRGSLLKYYHEGCKCHPNGKYGPYWYLSVKIDGKTKMRKLKEHQVAGVRKGIESYERWWKTCLKVFEMNTLMILSDEE